MVVYVGRLRANKPDCLASSWIVKLWLEEHLGSKLWKGNNDKSALSCLLTAEQVVTSVNEQSLFEDLDQR